MYYRSVLGSPGQCCSLKRNVDWDPKLQIFLNWYAVFSKGYQRYLALWLTLLVQAYVGIYPSATSSFVIWGTGSDSTIELLAKFYPIFYVRPASVRWKLTILEPELLTTRSCSITRNRTSIKWQNTHTDINPDILTLWHPFNMILSVQCT